MAPRRSRAGRCWPAPPLTTSSPLDPLPGAASKPPSPCAPASRTSLYRPRALQGRCSAPPRRLSRKTEQRRADSHRQYPRDHDKPRRKGDLVSFGGSAKAPSIQPRASENASYSKKRKHPDLRDALTNNGATSPRGPRSGGKTRSMKGVPSSRHLGGPPNRVVVLSGALSVVLISLLLYLKTLAPTVLYCDPTAFPDSVVLQVQAIVLGIPHTTGYPTWVMLTHL